MVNIKFLKFFLNRGMIKKENDKENDKKVENISKKNVKFEK